MKTHAFRLLPGDDLKKGITDVVHELDIKAGWILTGIGSLERINLRFANQDSGSVMDGYFEIVSLAGTLSVNGNHIHIAVSDSTGKTLGGHLLENNLVYTTVEIVIGYDEELIFTREADGTTAWAELQVRRVEKK